MQGSKIAKFGRSKEKHNDARLVVLAVVINREGFLKYSNIFEGNISDCKTLETMIDTLSNQTSYTKRKPIVVMDAGITTDDNVDPYLVFDSNISYSYKNFLVAFKIKNLLNAQYFHPGAEQADGGPEPASLLDDDGHYYRSGGFRNSMIPQPDRHFMLTISYNY